MEKHIALAVVLVALVIVGAVAVVAQLPRLAVYSYAKTVPVQIGKDAATDYWIISSSVTEQQAFKMVLNKGSQSGDTKTASEVGLLISPLNPYSKTNLDVYTIEYLSEAFGINRQKAPSYAVNTAGWLTTVAYELSVYKNNVQVGTMTRVDFNYKTDRNIEIDTGEGKIVVKNLGQLPQGVSVPTGDYVVVFDPDGDKHVFVKSDFSDMIHAWNDWEYYHGLRATEWKDVWDMAKTERWLPNDVQFAHISDIQYTTDMDYVTMTYSDIVFAGDIAVYIPSDLADTVIINVLAAKPQIVQVVPDPLPKIKEGNKSSFCVTVKNVGTQGTIHVSVSSDRYSFTPTTDSWRNMAEGSQAIFGWDAYALNVEGSTGELFIKVFAQGEGGTAIYQYRTLGIENVEGYTPPTPVPTTATLIVYVKDAATFQPVSDIAVSVSYGSKTATALSSSDGSLSFDLGDFTGSVQLKAATTETYTEKIESAEVKLGKNEHTILLGASWLTQYWWLILIVAVILIVVIVIFIAWKKEWI
jgi:hypothetical protein